MNAGWHGWAVVASAFAVGGALDPDARAALIVALAGIALAARWPVRAGAVLIALALTWGGSRTAAIDRAASPVAPLVLHGERLRMVDTLPAHGPETGEVGSARARLGGRSVVLSPARFGEPTPALRRGWVVAVDGRLVPLGDGRGDRRLARQGVAGRVLLQAARDTGARRGGVLGAIDGVARSAGEAASRAGGPRVGPVLAGMALGTAEEITPEDRDALRASGLWHLAAASGGNVALVVALVFVVGWLAGVPDRARLALAIAATAAYVPLAGAGPSIQRAGVMGIAALVGLAAGREHRSLDALALAAAATLALDPRAWLDLGWQLSFAATAALLLGTGAVSRRLTAVGVPRSLALGLTTTVLATLATAPLMLAAFGAVSAIGLVTNAAVAPLAAVAVWSGSLAALVAPIWPAGAALVAEPGAAAARATLAVAEWGAGRAHAQIGGSAAAIAVLGTGILLLVRPGRAVTAACGLAVLGALALWAPGAPDEPRVVVLDIGQGSAALLQAGTDAVLVDAGPVDGGVVAQLRRAGVRRLRAMILSHPAADHDGGGAAVLRAFPTEVLLDGGEPGGGPTHAAAIREARRRAVRVVPARAGQRLTAGAIDVRIRWPTAAAAHRPGDPNDRAAVVDATVGALRVLVPADAEGNVLARLRDLRADVLVVSHHGSADADLPSVLRTLGPGLAVISVGAHNDYGHPRAETLAALRRAGVPTLRTDQGGSVDLRREPGGLTVRRIAPPR